jgi:hypothetical protein
MPSAAGNALVSDHDARIDLNYALCGFALLK